MSKKSGILAILSGPSGVGKSSIIKRLLSKAQFALSVSATTRPCRTGEVHGVDYLFLSEKDFIQKIDNGEFLEHALVHGKDHYGTLKKNVKTLIDEGRIVILDIDVQGAQQLLSTGVHAISVFIAPPTMDDLEHRLRGRGTEDDASITQRLKTAAQELTQKNQYDHVVVNDDLEETHQAVYDLLIEAMAQQDTTNSQDRARSTQ